MKIYHYHPRSGELLSEGLADPDPLVEGGWLMPGYSTALTPPVASAGQVAVFTQDGLWSVLPDARGVWYGATQSEIRINDIEADVSGLTRTPPPSVDHDLVDGSWVLNTERASATLQRQLAAAVQAHMDSAAQARGYDNLLSAVSYADEPVVPSFQAEGQAFRAWRSRVWARCYELLALVQAGEMPAPADAELIAQLPALTL